MSFTSTSSDIQLEKDSSLINTLLLKYILIGDLNTGKTNIISRYIDNTFDSQHVSTINPSSHTKTTYYNNIKVKEMIWDTAGSERYNSISSVYYKGSKGVFIVFDLTCRQSFENVEYWIGKVNECCERDIEIVVLGNKSDLERREVNDEEINQSMSCYHIEYYEVSALSGKNIEYVFDMMMKSKYYNIVYSIIYIEILNKKGNTMTTIPVNNQDMHSVLIRDTNNLKDEKEKTSKKSRLVCCCKT